MVDFLDDSSRPRRDYSNHKFSPFFDYCIGAIDGSHIPAVVEESEQQAFRNCKGFILECVGCG